MNILVTGATGQLGSKIVNHILDNKADENIFVSVRNVEKATPLFEKGVTVRYGDFDDAASLDAAFEGIDRLVIVSTDGDTATRIRQHATAIEAAQRANVKLIVYTSLSDADTSTLNLAEVHKDTERRIIDSGIDYKILRNNWYLENELDTIKEAKDTGVITSTYGAGKAGWLLRDEYAEAAAAAVLGAGSVNTIYTLSNDVQTIDDFAVALGHVLDTEITVNHITDDVYAGYLSAAGLPSGVVDFVVAINRGIRDGGLDAPSHDFETLTGRKPKTLEESLKEVIGSLN